MSLSYAKLHTLRNADEGMRDAKLADDQWCASLQDLCTEKVRGRHNRLCVRLLTLSSDGGASFIPSLHVLNNVVVTRQ